MTGPSTLLWKIKISVADDMPKQDLFLLVCLIGVSLGILIEIVNEVEEDTCVITPTYKVYSKDSNIEYMSDILKHVYSVLERMGYKETRNGTFWVLLWAYDFMGSLHDTLLKLEAHQKVNHFPGSEFMTSKVTFATLPSKYIPKAFQLPNSKDQFLEYVERNKNALFLEKSVAHRGVSLKSVHEILLNMHSKKHFVQKFIQNPFLVDGHKFDIGVYVVITSVNPLRAYWYKGDVMFRYCLAKYNPLDPEILEKYVIDDYLPIWKMPILAQFYSTLGHNMKDSFDIYVRSKGKDPTPMWEEIQRAISEILIMNEHHIMKELLPYPSVNNFFETVRFDLIVDEDLKVYLLEANMSPNLRPGKFTGFALLYDQLLYNLFSLTGISRRPKANRDQTEVQRMMSSEKNIAVFSEQCQTICNDDCKALELCKLCKPCRSTYLTNVLIKTHTEFLHRGDFRRLVVPPMSPLKDVKRLPKLVPHNLSDINRLFYIWYQGKCNQDITWCT